MELSFAPESFHIGYSVHLHKAWRKLDPGPARPRSTAARSILCRANMRPQSSSAVRPPSNRPIRKSLVTLNAPLDFADPAFPGRSYRMFQSTMNGPYNPEEFGLKLGESAYLSGFTLNYDPGRGLTYVGCLLIVAGIFVAYFVRLRRPSCRAGRGKTMKRHILVAVLGLLALASPAWGEHSAVWIGRRGSACPCCRTAASCRWTVSPGRRSRRSAATSTRAWGNWLEDERRNEFAFPGRDQTPGERGPAAAFPGRGTALLMDRRAGEMGRRALPACRRRNATDRSSRTCRSWARMAAG